MTMVCGHCVEHPQVPEAALEAELMLQGAPAAFITHTTHTVVALDWRDRLRLLWHGRLELWVRTRVNQGSTQEHTAAVLIVHHAFRRPLREQTATAGEPKT